MVYRLSLAAQSDIVRLYDLSLATFGEKQTEIYIAGLRNTLAFLAANPRAARLRTEMQRSARIHPYKSHIIMYAIEEDDIFIVRIRHAHEDWVNEGDNKLD
jgi:toxin ParE1/3/4